MRTKLPTYDEARKAIRDNKNPRAFLHLGILYANGIGTLPNHVLANYFYDKAAQMGCKEVYQYIALEYKNGTRNLANDIEKAKDASGKVSSAKLKRFRKFLDTIGVKNYYGLLASVRQHFHLLYPKYEVKKAMDDILNDRDTLDADLYYAQCTSDNKSEVDLESQEQFLRQLYAPVLQDKDLLGRMKKYDDTDLSGTEVHDLLQAVVNITSSYDQICDTYNVERKTMLTIDDITPYPYITVATLSLLRKQALRGLLSIRHVHPLINEKYLKCLDNDEQLLTIFEMINDQDIQLFLVSFVELNINIEAIESTYLNLLNSYRKNDLAPLISHLNDFVGKLSKSGMEHHLPIFTSANLPSTKGFSQPL